MRRGLLITTQHPEGRGHDEIIRAALAAGLVPGGVAVFVESFVDHARDVNYTKITGPGLPAVSPGEFYQVVQIPGEWGE